MLGQALQAAEVEAPRISKQLTHEGAKGVSPMHWPRLPQGDIPCTHFC